MNRILRDELSTLADEGISRMAPADDLAAVLSVRFAHSRRRRPAIIAGTTCLVLATAGAAAAGVSLLRAEVTDLPDRITAGAVSPAAPTGLRCGREVGELQPSVLPMMLIADDPTNVAATTVDVARAFSERWALGLSLDNMTTSDMTVSVGDVAGLYLVEGGTVVAQPGPGGPTREQTLERGQGMTVLPDRPLLCSGGEAPDGTYEAYASVEVTVRGGDSAGTYDIVGGPWTVELGPPVAAPMTPARPGIPGLTALVPDVPVPQCGADVDTVEIGAGTWSGGSDERPGSQVGWALDAAPTATAVDGSGRSTVTLHPQVIGGQMTGYPTSTIALVIVTDGVVVGTSMPDGPAGVAATAPSDLAAQDDATGAILYRACAPGTADAGPLPAGQYSIWATQTFHLTGRAAAPPEGGTPVAEVVDEDIVAYGRVSDLWIGADGRPVAGPTPAAGWPAEVSDEVAFAGTGEELSVVWLSTTGTVSGQVMQTIIQEPLATAGYGSAVMPVACQPRAAAVLNLPKESPDAWGIGVVFATRAEADAFTDLFGFPGTIVQGEVACDVP